LLSLLNPRRQGLGRWSGWDWCWLEAGDGLWCEGWEDAELVVGVVAPAIELAGAQAAGVVCVGGECCPVVVCADLEWGVGVGDGGGTELVRIVFAKACE